MANSSHGLHDEALVFKVLKVDLCARAIFDVVPLKDLVRSQRVSREWQGIVNQYLHSCRNFRFHYVLRNGAYSNPHRKIEISPETYTLSQAGKILDKWGPMIVEMNGTGCWHEIFETKPYVNFTKVIAAKCPNLQKIETFVADERVLNNIKRLKHLKHVSFYYMSLFTKNQDRVLGELFEGIDCESIFINANVNITGTFLKSANSNLKSLGFRECNFLKVPVMLSAIDNLRNVTKLQVDDSHISFISEVHLLLKEMPQLEELSLRNYIPIYGDVQLLDNESLDAFSGLVNLKRLNMENTHHVNDALLKALARGCKQLELLDIRGNARRISVDGLAALCRRSPSAVTTLHFGLPYYELDDYTLEEYFHKHFWRVPLFEELERLGCVEMSLEWFRDACLDSCGRELNLNAGPGGSIVRVEGPQKTLKVVVFDDAFENGWEEFDE